MKTGSLPNDNAPIALCDLPLGRIGKVLAVDGEPEFRQRLLELGLVPGVEVKATRVAPLGDPMRIELRGAGFSIRKGEARQVLVDPLPPCPEETDDNASMPTGEIRQVRVALVGNPNVGKTSLFNALTGHSGHVGNYPGSTVDRLVGKLDLADDLELELVDVPGTYTLNARSRDEQVAISELMGLADRRPPDVVIVVLRYATLQRGLYFLMQVQELGQTVVGVVNMLDEARKNGFHVDLDGLSNHFGIPMVGTVSQTGEGLQDLKDQLAEVLRATASQSEECEKSEECEHPEHVWHWTPSAHLTEHLDDLATDIASFLPPETPKLRQRAFALWCLMSLRPRDHFVEIPRIIRDHVISARKEMLAEGHDLNLEVTQSRYHHIDEDVDRYGWKEERHRDVSQVIDGVVTHPLWGSVVFLLAMALIFIALFDWSAPLVDAIEWTFGRVGAAAQDTFGSGIFGQFIANGLVAGVGSVVVFLPQILLLFFFVTLLEASGYMARAAFMMDRLMQKLGLHGRAFVPMLTGFACAVPAVMAARTIERRRDRMLTIMVLPLISCSARLPVYTLIISALFPADQRIWGPLSLGAAMMLGLYLTSTLLTLIAVGVLGRTVLKGKPAPLLLELPPYRLPSVRAVFTVLYHRTRIFLRTAGTVILAATVLLWVFVTFPRADTFSRDYDRAITLAKAEGKTQKVQQLKNAKRSEQLEQSIAGRIGQTIEPLIAPLGFDWKIGVGLVGAFAAREVFVSTMGLIYGVGGDATETSRTLRQAMKSQQWADGKPVYTPLMGLSLLLFFMIALQCLSTVAVVRQETGGWRWTAFQLLYLYGLAYIVSFSVYQGGRLLGWS
ncbi:MAG: ferrous iron transport protein B [Deltaproteobacteria bacterium]|nr:ferrous iron transport protein B [Deltaproteobacteria bacterium]